MYIYHWNYLQFLNKVIIMKGKVLPKAQEI
jgi:hypothetical protein